MNDLGLLYCDRGRMTRPSRCSGTALEARRDRLGADHLDTLESMGNLAILLHRARADTTRPSPCTSRRWTGGVPQLGADHPHTLAGMHNLAVAVPRPGAGTTRPSRFSIKCWRPAAQTSAPITPTRSTPCTSLAVLYQSRGQLRPGRAASTSRSWRAAVPDRAPTTPTAPHHAAAWPRTTCMRGRYDQAEPLFKEVLAAQRVKPGADHPDTIITMSNLGVLYRDRGRYREAEPLFREALAGARKTHGLGHPNTHTIYQPSGHPPRQTGYAAPRRAAAARAGLVPARPTRAGSVTTPTSSGPVREPAGAEEIRRGRAVRAGLPGHPRQEQAGRLDDVLHQVPARRCALGQKKYAEAEPLLEQGYAGMKEREAKIAENGKVYLTQALEWLVQLHDARGNRAEAAKWRKELEAPATGRRAVGEVAASDHVFGGQHRVAHWFGRWCR